MRKIEKSTHIPDTLQNAPIPTCPDEVSPAFYRAKDVQKQLLEDQHNKCAYCESWIPKDYNDVEHYRPKSIYYWLGHDWHNLLYACPICNRSYKKDLFPLKNEAARVTSPGNLTCEEPLIINPATDDPALHIQYKRYMMKGITEEGKKTIELFHLNERDELVLAREQVFEKYSEVKEIAEKAKKILNSPDLTDDLRHSIQDILTHSLASITAYISPDTPYSGMLVNQ